MKWKIIFTVLVPIILLGYVYAQQDFKVGVYKTAGVTTTMTGSGAYSTVYQIKLGNRIDTIFVKFEGTMNPDSMKWCSIDAYEDSFTLARTPIDSTFFIRYDGQMMFHRLRICRVAKNATVGTTDSTINIWGYREDR